MPLVFDKCENCGHTLEFARDEQELQFILRGIDLPQVSYNKICSKCKSINPRETGSCLYCGSTDFQLQYDLESIQKYNESINRLSDNSESQQLQGQPQIIINPQNVKVNWLFRLIALIIGVIDFFFFSFVGLSFIFDENTVPTTTAGMMIFVTQNVQSLMLVIIASLLIAGILAVFILPKMSYKDSFQTTSLIGIVVGLITLMVSRDVAVVLISMIVCAIITGIGGLIGELLVQKLFRRLGSRRF
ncbi:hypothetical protein NL43_05005 [Methanosphaera sp. WGK6]|nr:hypothetical protein NL43_05005 [Methanosphaera sp. WGK6]